MYHFDKKNKTHIWQQSGITDMTETYLKTEKQVESRNWNLEENKKLYIKTVIDYVEDKVKSDWAFGCRGNDPKKYIKDVVTGVSTNYDLMIKLETLVKETKFNHNAKAQRRRRKRSEFDGEFNFERGMAGEADIFDVRTKVDNERAIDFYIGNNCLAMFDKNLYEKRVVEFMAKVVKAMERGYMVRVATFALNEGLTQDGKNAAFINVVKEYKDPIDLHLIANICQIGFFRSFGFAKEIVFLDNKGIEADNGLGRTVDSPNEVLPVLRELGVNKGYFYQMTNNIEVNIKTGEQKEYKLNEQ